MMVVVLALVVFAEVGWMHAQGVLRPAEEGLDVDHPRIHDPDHENTASAV